MGSSVACARLRVTAPASVIYQIRYTALVTSYGGDLIREARLRAGLTQAELAARAETGQPSIARWESGTTAVSLNDVIRLVRLCGLDLELHLVPRDDSDMAQAARLVELSGEERLDRHARVARQFRALRGAGEP
ncbi:hypothetical protein A5658_05010 [Mycobacterium sp. 1245111.1]|nr:hypothetical protein A5658_05010 [Mycobacterium sp. 1245111.1]